MTTVIQFPLSDQQAIESALEEWRKTKKAFLKALDGATSKSLLEKGSAQEMERKTELMKDKHKKMCSLERHILDTCPDDQQDKLRKIFYGY